MIVETLGQELEYRTLSMNDFSTVVRRLLERQVIYRHESRIESELYDLYLRMDDLINDYLGVIGIVVVCHRGLNFIIAYPPGSDIPGVSSQDIGESALQRRIRADEAGLMITLRLLFEEKVREGDVRENGCVYVPLETVFTRYLSITKREMPVSEIERRSIFNTLRQLRIIEYSDLSTPDQWIGIREIILYFTLDGVSETIEDMDSTDHPDHQDVTVARDQGELQ